MDTLQHNVDLGAQNSYLIATLEEHKNDLKKAFRMKLRLPDNVCSIQDLVGLTLKFANTPNGFACRNLKTS